MEYYSATTGMHPGLDWGVPYGTPLIWTGSSDGIIVDNGTQRKWPYFKNPNGKYIVVRSAGFDFIYGHVSGYEVDLGDCVSYLHHSGQGSHYTSVAYQTKLRDANIQASMSRVGNCYDNAVVESFFATLKSECVIQQFASHTAARSTIFEYIKAWYNRKRLHSTLGYLSLIEFEQQHGH